MNHQEDVREHARAYVDRVLDRQREMGYGAQMSDEAYQATIERAAQGFASLTDREERADEDAVSA